MATAKELQDAIIELRQQLSEGGDDVDSLLIIGETIKAKKVELVKIEATERMAKVNKLSVDILELVKPVFLEVLGDMQEVQCEGFTCRHIGDTPDGLDFKLLGKGVTKSASTPSTTGTTKALTGMALGEIYDKFANSEEIAEHDGYTGEKNTNSSQWRVKCKVRDRAIAEGLVATITS